MSDQEDVSEKSNSSIKSKKDDAASKPIPTVTITDAPPGRQTSSDQGDQRHLRSSSPGRLSASLTLKVQTQMNRVASIEELKNSLPESADTITLSELNAKAHQLDELHKAFIREHCLFEATWPAGCIDHEYFSNNVYKRESDAFVYAKVIIGRLQHSLQLPPNPKTVPRHSPQPVASNLPEINIPPFDGNYRKWPEFHDLFDAIIIQCQYISDAKRMHYLKTHTTGDAATLISGFSVTGESFRAAWELLCKRYENKRLLIQFHLDQLFNMAPITNKNAANLNKLISTVTEATKALESLGVTNNLLDCILVHHVSKNLDKATREAWETSLGSSQTYPQFAQLEEFVTNKVRALERIEAGSSTNSVFSVKTSPNKKAASHHAAAQAPPVSGVRTTKSNCACCNGKHFIVTCEKFRGLAPVQRRRLVTDKRLCYNCLGFHSARNCVSTATCKECTGKHHTMLHEALDNYRLDVKPGNSASGSSSAKPTPDSSTASKPE